MALAIIRSCALDGVRPRSVHVEVHIGGGLPSMSIVGLPNSAVRESRDRVRAALSHLNFSLPQVRVVVNLAPADVPKDGGGFDLPIALGLLVATGQLPARSLEGMTVLGELGLGGELRPVPGVLPVALGLADSSGTLLLPSASFEEAALSRRTRLLGAATLVEACDALRRGERGCIGQQHAGSAACADSAAWRYPPIGDAPDMTDVLGQQAARRAVEIAAAGGHGLLLHGPPGTGKSMLARRLPGLCAPLTMNEALEVASVRSVSGRPFDMAHWGRRPFRAPHHTASAVALVGGGIGSRPGEITLAHHGVLFLDEFAEFPRRVLDALREPLETGRISVSRASRRATWPAAFQLVAAMNPCPCGYHGDRARCRCGEEIIKRYQARVSGPLLDRLDLVTGLQRPMVNEERRGAASEPESSAAIRARVIIAVQRQRRRQGVLNARLPPRALRAIVADRDVAALLVRANERLALSRRGSDRVLRVARTIADLGERDAVRIDDLAQALAYRPASGHVNGTGFAPVEPLS